MEYKELDILKELYPIGSKINNSHVRGYLFDGEKWQICKKEGKEFEVIELTEEQRKMRCKVCFCCRKGWFPSRPNDYVCTGVREPFIIENIENECTEY